MPGEMIVLGMECTQREAELMEVAAQINAQVRALEQDEAQFIVKYYDLLEAITATGSAGLGAGALAMRSFSRNGGRFSKSWIFLWEA